jgi:hypothetical protein
MGEAPPEPVLQAAAAFGPDARRLCRLFFCGAFAAKVLLVHGRRLPGRPCRKAGGTLAIIVGVL